MNMIAIDRRKCEPPVERWFITNDHEKLGDALLPLGHCIEGTMMMGVVIEVRSEDVEWVLNWNPLSENGWGWRATRRMHWHRVRYYPVIT